MAHDAEKSARMPRPYRPQFDCADTECNQTPHYSADLFWSGSCVHMDSGWYCVDDGGCGVCGVAQTDESLSAYCAALN